MAEDERQDSSLWLFLLGFFLGALITGGGITSYYVVQQQRLGQEIREAREQVDRVTNEAMMAEAEARRARVQAEVDLRNALEALAKIKKEK